MKPELANRTVAGLKAAGINFVSYIPETRLSEILPLMKADDSFTLVPVASEAEAVGIAAGASLGGKRAAVYMEGTGLFVSTYNLLTVGERYGVPMLLLVAYVGSFEDQRNSYLVFSLRQQDQRDSRDSRHSIFDRRFCEPTRSAD